MTGTTARYCPLCDVQTDAQLCPSDHVATLPRALVHAHEQEQAVEAMGTIFAGRYRIERELGSGGFGRVYVATQLSMGREVALKTLHANLVGNASHVRRFYREARAASRLDSVHVVRIFDFGLDEEKGTPFIVMEYLKGQPLDALLKDGRTVGITRAVRIVAQVAHALGEAHEAGVVHRDMKPPNIFLVRMRTGREFVKVMDFGIAKVLHADDGDTGESLTATGTALGTPRYMSPEQATADKVDFRSDLYAVGCILHEMLTGTTVFQADDRVSLMLQHVTAEAPELPEQLPSGETVPEALRVLHKSLLRKRRDERPATCRAVSDICEALEAGRPVDAQAVLVGARTKHLGSSALRQTIAPRPGEAPVAYDDPSADLLAQTAAAHTTDGNPSLGMLSAELVALDRALRRPQRLRVALAAAIVLLLAGGGAAWHFNRPPVPDIHAGQKTPEKTEPVVPPPAPRANAGATPDELDPAEPGTKRPLSPTPKAPPKSAPAPARAEPAPKPPPTPAPPALAHVVLRTRPSKVRVYRGSKRICTTPCDLELPPAPEPVAFRLTRRGYRSKLISLTLRPGADIERHTVLSRKPRASSKREVILDDEPPSKTRRKTAPPKGTALPGIRMD